MPDQNDLNKPDLGSSYNNEVLETLRGHIARLWTGTWGSMAGVVNGMLRWEIPGGNVLRLWRRNGSGTDDLVFDSTSLLGDGTVTTPKLANGAVTTAKLADASVTTAKLAPVIAPVVSSLNGGQLAGMRNKIINGKMDISQRGTSFAPIVSGVYSLDRYRWANDTVAQVTITQQADAPSTNEFSKSLRVQVTTSGSAPFNSAAHITQCVEGFNARDLIGRTFTLSFWVRSSKTGVHCVTFTNGPTILSIDRTFITEYTINAANTWEYKTVTVLNGLITSGSFWNWENGTGLQVRWILGCGPTLHGSPNAWLTGERIATSNQVNCLDTVGNIFAITGVQLEPGASATPFEHRSYGAERALCQQYGRPVFSGATGRTGSATSLDLLTVLSPEMRVAPTLVFGGFAGANTTVAQLGVGNVTVTGISSSNNTPRSVYAAFNTTGATTGSILAVTAGDLAFASAEL